MRKRNEPAVGCLVLLLNAISRAPGCFKKKKTKVNVLA